MLLGPVLLISLNLVLQLCRRWHTLYPKKVGLQPVTTPLSPSTFRIFVNASKLLLYRLASTCRRHLITSNGVTAVWVRPCRCQ